MGRERRSRSRRRGRYRPASRASTPTMVPEPDTLLLVSLGMFGLVVRGGGGAKAGKRRSRRWRCGRRGAWLRAPGRGLRARGAGAAVGVLALRVLARRRCGLSDAFEAPWGRRRSITLLASHGRTRLPAKAPSVAPGRSGRCTRSCSSADRFLDQAAPTSTPPPRPHARFAVQEEKIWSRCVPTSSASDRALLRSTDAAFAAPRLAAYDVNVLRPGRTIGSRGNVSLTGRSTAIIAARRRWNTPRPVFFFSGTASRVGAGVGVSP